MTMNFQDLIPPPNWKTCPKCEGQFLGTCTVCDEAARQQKSRAVRIAAGEATIPPEYEGARFDNPSALTVAGRTWLAEARGHISQRRVVLLGPAGIGKTRLASAMLRAWMATTGQSALFVSAYKLGLVRIQHRAGDGDALLVEEVMRAPLVLVDDLGQERMTANNALPDVIQHRHEQHLPTWVTIGCGLDKGTAMGRVAEIYASDGIARRVFEGAKVLDLHLAPRAPQSAPPAYDGKARAAGDDS